MVMKTKERRKKIQREIAHLVETAPDPQIAHRELLALKVTIDGLVATASPYLAALNQAAEVTSRAGR
jgi:hypothetical protein